MNRGWEGLCGVGGGRSLNLWTDKPDESLRRRDVARTNRMWTESQTFDSRNIFLKNKISRVGSTIPAWLLNPKPKWKVIREGTTQTRQHVPTRTHRPPRSLTGGWSFGRVHVGGAGGWWMPPLRETHLCRARLIRTWEVFPRPTGCERTPLSVILGMFALVRFTWAPRRVLYKKYVVFSVHVVLRRT